jgi:Uncharacterized conserved protein (DUF2039)
MKFVRNRDIKLKNVEIKKEQSIQKLMCEGVCGRCREKVQWKFKYDKYKPLTRPATCSNCKRKNITKAYRTFCDGCAGEKKVCPSCCRDMQEANNEYYAKHPVETDGDNEDSQDVDSESKSVQVTTAEVAGEQTMTVDAGGDSDIEEEVAGVKTDADNVDDEDDVKMEQGHHGHLPKAVADNWDERAFAHIINSKYNKNRVVGSSSDNIP